MNRIMIRAGLIASALGLLTIGIGGGYWWGQRHADTPAEVSQPAVPAPQERQVLYWFDPMVPDQHFDQPGKSPFMDMELVPRYADQAATAGVRIDPGVQQNVGIRTAIVEVGQLTVPIRATATLTWDLRRESVVSARVDAIIAQLHVKAPFESVRRGQPLATVLAPAWSSAIAEAQTLEEADSAAAKSLHTAAMQRLRLLGLSDTRLGRDGSVVLLAPSDGVVREVLVREGQAVAADMPLFRVNGTATVWLEAAIPQASVGGIGPGTKVEATLSAMPGRRFAGEVEALLPQIEPTSRTQWARIVLNNPDGRLVPGMFAELTLQSAGAEQVPLIPAAALIATGDDSRVIVMRSDGGFEPVRVRTGRSGGGRIEILEGLQGGEHIVTSGQFLIDSEASLSGALQRLGAPTPAASAPPDATENRP